MKRFLLFCGIILFAIQANAQFSKATLQATGLTCAMCSNAINKALEKVPFVESVRSDIKNSAFNIVFKAGSEINVDQLKEAVEDAGFSVGSLKLTGSFETLSLEKDSHFKLGQYNFHYIGENAIQLNGEQTLTIVDKDYVTAKEFRKLSASTKHACYDDGKAGACCEAGGMNTGERIYHVKI